MRLTGTARAGLSALALSTVMLCGVTPATAKVITTLPGGVAKAFPTGINRPNSEMSFGNGVTYLARRPDGQLTSSLVGELGAFSFSGSTTWNQGSMASIGIQTAIMSFTFDDPVSAALAEFNWARQSDGPAITLRAFNAAGALLESVTFASTDPAYTTGFYGFQRAANDISRFEIDGYWTGARNLSTSTATISAVPEPATWAMMIIGFGAAGSILRSERRRAAVLAA